MSELPMASGIVVHCAHDKIVPLERIEPNPRNPNKHPAEQVALLAKIIREQGWRAPITVSTRSGLITKGHGRLLAAHLLEVGEAPVDYQDYDSAEEEWADLLADNRLAELAEIDLTEVADIMGEFSEAFDTDLTGWDETEMDFLMAYASGNGGEPGDPMTSGEARAAAKRSLNEQFVVPPFTVLDARQGYWQDRKRAWLALGLQSELGRERGLLSSATERQGYGSGYDTSKGENAWGGSGTSIFDPVVCELVYRWFCPEGGTVLDPFAGGSVRGVVAGLLGRAYTGIDLSGRQIEANREQWREIGAPSKPAVPEQPPVEQPDELTPIEEMEALGGILVKRDDLFGIAGARGGKVRTCWHLAQGAEGLVTAGSRHSPQVNIVARIAAHLGIPCQVHTPSGELGPEVSEAKAYGAEVVQHRPGYNSVIVARAREAAEQLGWREIPFGMECAEAVQQTRRQVANLGGTGARRIVIPVGSGMSLAGVLHGLRAFNIDLPVLGVQVGADPTKRLDEYAPSGWREMVELVESDLRYEDRCSATQLGDLALDPIYEAKCLPYLREGDLLWVVGIRPSETTPVRQVPPVWIEGDSAELPELLPSADFDLVFSCPPYLDLEVYSDDPRDLSRLEHDEFIVKYRHIIQMAAARLRQDRFAVFVVGDVRDARGLYRRFVVKTIQAFEDAGCHLYNDAVLVTAVGSLPIRAGRHFQAARKLGKAHQNILVFYKGDPKKIREVFGDVQCGELAAPTAEEVAG